MTPGPPPPGPTAAPFDRAHLPYPVLLAAGWSACLLLIAGGGWLVGQAVGRLSVIIAPLAIVGCVGLYLFLPLIAKMVLIVWGAIGLLIYFGYSRSRSHVGRGIIDVVSDPNLQPELADRD